MLEPHRTMQRPGEGIVRPNGAGPQHSEYPKHMVHPAFQPGKPDREVKVIDPETGQPTWKLAYVGGTSIRFPPVLVMDANQEEYHASQGYVSIGKSDPAAFAKAVRAAAPTAEVHKPEQYPKWLASLNRSVNSAEEEAELLGMPLPAAASSEQPGDAPAANAEVGHLFVPRLVATPANPRLEALESKVDAIADSFSRLEAMLARIAGAAPAAPPNETAPQPAEPPKTGERSAASIARGEKIKAGIAAAKKAAEETAPPDGEPAAQTELVVADDAQAVE